MTYEDRLVCASCSGRVSEARCPACRLLMRNRRQPAVSTATMVWLAGLVALLLVLLQHR